MLYETYKSKLFILHVTPEPYHPEQLSIYLPKEKLEELRTSQKKEHPLPPTVEDRDDVWNNERDVKTNDGYV